MNGWNCLGKSAENSELDSGEIAAASPNIERFATLMRSRANIAIYRFVLFC